MSDDKPPNPGGRPLIEIDMKKLEALMQLDPTCADAATQMGCSEATVERRIKEATGLTFLEFKQKHMAGVRLSLVQQALKLAREGDVTALFKCLKHFNGWNDSGGVQVNVQNNVNQTVNIDSVDLEERIKQIKGETDGKD